MYIDGDMKSSIDNLTKDIYSPLNGQKIASLAWGNQKDSLLALESASKGFEVWSKLPLNKRKEWMSILREKILENEVLLRKAISYEMGKPYSATAEDIESITNSLKYYADIIDDFVKPNKIAVKDETYNHKLISKPIGVVVAYLAWNFPLLNAGFKIGPALASGCSLILKPSELSPVSLYIIGNLLKQINFPKGVINIICGEPTDVAQTLSKSTIPNLITMIGSTETAKKVISDSSTSIKKYSMELGGNAPFIIFDDADIDTAINKFDLKNVLPNSAIFDEKKLLWLNGLYIRSTDTKDFQAKALSQIENDIARELFDEEKSRLIKIFPSVQERIETLADLTHQIMFLIDEPFNVDTLDWQDVNSEEAQKYLFLLREELIKLDNFTLEIIETIKRKILKEINVKPKVGFQAVRVSITGTKISPPLFESIFALGKQAVIARLAESIEKL